jgi:hypothetical protein
MFEAFVPNIHRYIALRCAGVAETSEARQLEICGGGLLIQVLDWLAHENRLLYQPFAGINALSRFAARTLAGREQCLLTYCSNAGLLSIVPNCIPHPRCALT